MSLKIKAVSVPALTKTGKPSKVKKVWAFKARHGNRRQSNMISQYAYASADEALRAGEVYRFNWKASQR